MVKKYPFVSIVISNFNGLALNLILDSLSSVLKETYPNMEVILVDNASTDESVRKVRRKFGSDRRLKIIENKVNMYSQGLNLGVENSIGEFIFFLNNDIEFKKGYIQRMLNVFKENPEVALVQGKLLYFFNHQILDSIGETMDIYGNPITIGGGEKDTNQYSAEMEILSASGSASAIRKSAIEAVGKFDPEYGVGYEDMDLALRLRLKGWRVLYSPDAVIYHKRGQTDLSSIVRVKVRWHFNKNRLATMIKNYPLKLLIRTLPITLAIYVGAGVWEIFLKRKLRLGVTRYTSIFWVAINLLTLLSKRGENRKAIDETGEVSIVNLLSKRSIFQSFISFSKVK